MNIFENQVIQIASLGVWQIITGGKMTTRLEQVEDLRWKKRPGLFITLRRQGHICGSMGVLEPTTNLDETLFVTGQTAATHDPRFPPLSLDDIQDLEIQVTLLSETKKLHSLNELKVGEMGLIVTRGEKQGVLLPHVATDNGWNSQQFIEAACEKAHLDHEAWKDPNTLTEYFTSQTLDGGPLLRNIEAYI